MSKGAKPKILDAEGAVPYIVSATGISGIVDAPFQVRHTRTASLRMVPGTHGFQMGIPHTAVNLKMVPGAHSILSGLLHTAENWKLVPGVHSADILADVWDASRTDTTFIDIAGNRVTGKSSNTNAGAAATKWLHGNPEGSVALVYFEWEIIKNIIDDNNGIKLGMGDEFYNSGYRGICNYNSDGTYQGGSGYSTFTDGDIIRVAVRLQDVGPNSTNGMKLWYAVNAGAWEGGGDPVLDTSPSVGPISVQWPMCASIAFDAPFLSSVASDARLRTKSSEFSYSIPTGFTAYDASPRAVDPFMDEDATTIGVGPLNPVVPQSVGSGFTFRCVIPASALSNGPGSVVRVQPSTGNTGFPLVQEIWIGHKGAGTFDFDGNQVEVLSYIGVSGYSAEYNHWDMWSDALSFSYDDTQPLVVSWYQQTLSQIYRSSSPGAQALGRRSGNFAGTTSGAGFSTFGPNYYAGMNRLAIIS